MTCGKADLQAADHLPVAALELRDLRKSDRRENLVAFQTTEGADDTVLLQPRRYLLQKAAWPIV